MEWLSFFAQSHGVVNGQAIRVHGSTANNLNTVKPVTVIDANHFSISYNPALETVPANGTYTSSTDANLYFSVDGNLPPTPFPLAPQHFYERHGASGCTLPGA